MKRIQDICICETIARFRPSDWAQRLAGLAAQFGPDNRLRYSPYLQPVRRAERQCLRLDGRTRTEDPSLWQSVIDFAQQNRLSVERSKTTHKA